MEAYELYTCEKCKESFQKKKHLKDHLLIHAREIFQCDMCQALFYSNELFKDHIAIHNLDSMCTSTSKDCRKLMSYEDHMMSRDDNSLKIKNSLEDTPTSTLMESIECKQIDLELTPSTFGEITAEELFRGSTLAHDLSNYYKIKKMMKMREKARKSENKDSDLDRRYVCDVCQKGFKKISHLKDHIRSHTGEKPFECPHPDCKLSFSTSGSRKRHLITHSGEKPYSCPHCNKSFQRIGLCESHIRAHIENPESLLESEIAKSKPFKCPQPYCGVRLSRKSTLKRHLLMHAGKLPYACADCGKSFKTWSIKKKHCEDECRLRNSDRVQMATFYASADRQLERFVLLTSADLGSAVEFTSPAERDLPNPYVKLTRIFPEGNVFSPSRIKVRQEKMTQHDWENRTDHSFDPSPSSADLWTEPENVLQAPEEIYYYQLGIKDPFLRATLIKSLGQKEPPTDGPTSRGRRAGVSAPPHYFLCPGCGLRFGRKRADIFSNHLILQHGYSTENASLHLIQY